MVRKWNNMLKIFFILVIITIHISCWDEGTDVDGVFLFPAGIAVESDGDIVVVDSQLKAVLGVDPVTGNRTILSEFP